MHPRPQTPAVPTPLSTASPAQAGSSAALARALATSFAIRSALVEAVGVGRTHVRFQPAEKPLETRRIQTAFAKKVASDFKAKTRKQLVDLSRVFPTPFSP
jgi:hypothetical protein